MESKEEPFQTEITKNGEKYCVTVYSEKELRIVVEDLVTKEEWEGTYAVKGKVYSL